MTKHQLKSSHKSKEVELDVDEDHNIFPIDYIFYTHNFWICMGCELATLEVQYRGLDDDDEEPINTKFFPTRAIKIRDSRDFSSIPKEINQTYKEVISCFNERNYILAAIGIRAILEAICRNLNITDKESFGLKGKLTILKERNLFSNSIINALNEFKFLGDDAAHKLISPNFSEVVLALSVLDDLLEHQYEAKYNLENSADRLHNFRAKNKNQ
ncbi:MAG: DUF4145 domain-containing protein [Bacteroidota bacterium]|nr:DUF4145 domain-containing protein [Bacteroidota bacterium]